MEDADSAVRVSRSCVSSSGVVGGRRRPAGNSAQDSRLGRRADVRPGRAVAPSADVGANVQRTCRRRVCHDVHWRPPVSSFQLRRQRLTTSMPSLLLYTYSFRSPATLHTLSYAW